MKTSPQQTSPSGEDESTFSLEDFRVSHSVMPGSEAARRMTATSGRTCSAALTKSDPIGLLLRTLLESSRWSSRARYLRWQVRQLFSTRLTTFDDTNCERPLSCNASATTLKVTDMPSSRCLFQLAVSEPPTEETGCSSSDVEMEKIPTFHGDQWEEAVRAVKNMVAGGLLNTPVADGLKCRTTHHGQRRMNGEALKTLVDLLPTPRANVVNGCNLNNSKLAERHKSNLEEKVARIIVSQDVDDGIYFQLSPLFTDEMMGFPLMWTALPFLTEKMTTSANGDTKPSKPTATPSSHK